jgi:hypothetical protein
MTYFINFMSIISPFLFLYENIFLVSRPPTEEVEDDFEDSDATTTAATETTATTTLAAFDSGD